MKICVITKCEDWADDFMVLRGNQWRYYDELPPGEIKTKPLKVPPFRKGEVLLLDKYDVEIGPLVRKPYKWGAEREFSQGKCETEFEIVYTMDDAIALLRELATAL